MKKTLILVRHATAEDHSFRINDFDRNLNNKGLAEAEAMGKWLAEKGDRPDILITSSAPRASKTAEIFANSLGVKLSSINSQEELYDGGPKAYLNAVNGVPEELSCLILFGHNPDISYFAEYLSGKDLGTMKKSGVVFIEFEDQQWNEISGKTGKMVLYKTPKELRDSL